MIPLPSRGESARCPPPSSHGVRVIYPARQLPDSLSLKGRSYAFACVRSELYGGVLTVRQGKNADVYAVAEEPSGDGEPREFVVLNLASGEVYQVGAPRIAGEVGRCTCWGFRRWKSCKHEQCMSDLVQERALPAL